MRQTSSPPRRRIVRLLLRLTVLLLAGGLVVWAVRATWPVRGPDADGRVWISDGHRDAHATRLPRPRS